METLRFWWWITTTIVALAATTKIDGTVAFLTHKSIAIAPGHAVGNLRRETTTRDARKGTPKQHRVVLRAGYEYIPPNPDASPGSFHMAWLKSSYPEGTPAGLRGEAVRSALVTTERCIGWNLSSNAETDTGGLLQISGRGTLEFLNGKLTRDFRTTKSFQEACLLDAKGRLIDRLKVTLDEDHRRALVLTSPGYSSADLLRRLDPFVFPMDEVELTNFCNDSDNENNHRSFSFTLASTQYKHVQKAIQNESKWLSLGEDEMVFPGASQAFVWKPKSKDDIQILVVPSTGLPSTTCVGYTFCFFGPGTTAATLGKQVWEDLIGEENLEGPVEVGALEYETLRVEAGQPAYGHEFGMDYASKRQTEPKLEAPTSKGAKLNKKDLIKTSPFELHFNSLIDLDKGCYLGQEGVASVLKNPRGPPRTLYTVVFEDDFNIYESQSRGDKSDFDNLTTLPKPGQKLYALGSNEELQVGTITSMGEAGGTGSRFTVGLALIKRAESIQRQMKKLDLEIPRDVDDFVDVDVNSGSGMIQPPPLDPLEGLEVIVEGTFTMGVLKAIPTRQSGIRRNANMYDPDIEVEGIEDEYEYQPPIPSPPTDTEKSVYPESAMDNDEDDATAALADLEQMEAEVAKANAEAEAAAAEAKRKAEKMELLKKRAEEAMARRRKKAAAQSEPAAGGQEEQNVEEDAAAAEAKRKAEKMALLKKRADEAMARRKAKKEQES